jgi:hypothetical protein
VAVPLALMQRQHQQVEQPVLIQYLAQLHHLVVVVVELLVVMQREQSEASVEAAAVVVQVTQATEQAQRVILLQLLQRKDLQVETHPQAVAFGAVAVEVVHQQSEFQAENPTQAVRVLLIH